MMKSGNYTENTHSSVHFFINKLDSNYANQICIVMNYNNQYKYITVIVNFLNFSLIHWTVHMLLYNAFIGFKIYKDNRMVNGYNE